MEEAFKIKIKDTEYNGVFYTVLSNKNKIIETQSIEHIKDTKRNRMEKLKSLLNTYKTVVVVDTDEECFSIDDIKNKMVGI